MTTPNPFQRLHALGYVHLTPVIPPDAEISENSTLFRRIGTKQDARGKVPGLRGQNGKWYSFDWPPYQADERDYERWTAMGAGVGIKTGDQGDGYWLVPIDADLPNAEHAAIAREEIATRVQPLWTRFGQPPKAVYLVRVLGQFVYRKIDVGDESDRVELLSDRKFFVAEGIHRKTGKPYQWPDGLPAYDDVPIVEASVLIDMLEAMRRRLPASEVKSEGGAAEQSQGALKGDIEAVRRAVKALPNSHNTHPSRESYRDVGYAIKAALPDQEAEAFEIWEEWCGRWQHPTTGELNDHDVVEADWRRMKAPFRRGAAWLYDQAQDLSGGAYTKADPWFETLPEKVEDAIGLFDQAMAQQAEASPKEPPIKWVRPSEWAGMEPKPREWEVEGWIPRFEVCLLYGDGGIGKTLAIHQYATAAAAGVDWLGQKTRKAKVMCFFCEDSEDELMRRQIDINKSIGLTFDQADANLRIASRKYMDNLLILWDRNTGALKRQAVWDQLKNDALEFGAEVIVVDTIADTFGGNEIDRAQVNAFIKSCLGRLAQEINGTVIALGHPSLSGKQSGSGTSGSTAWSNAVRSRMYLRYPKGVDKGNIRELEGMKLNYGAKGNLLKLRWHGGAFDVLAASVSPVSPESAPNPSDGLATVESASDMAVFDAVQAQAGLGVAMSLKPNSPHYAPKVLKRREPELLAGYSLDEVESAFARLERSGAIREVEVGRKENRHSVMGYEAVADAVVTEADTGEGGPGVFD